MGLSIVGLLERGGWRRAMGVGLFAAALVAAVYQHQTLYLPLQQHANRWAVRIAETIRRTTKPEDVIVIYGCDWSSEIPYYAQRRALMLPPGSIGKAAESAFRELDSLSVGAMVIVGPQFGQGWRPPSAEDYVKQRRRWNLSSAACYRDQACEVYPAACYEGAYQAFGQAMNSLNEGKLDAALDRFNGAIAGFADDPSFYFGRAQCQMFRGDMTSMRSDCTRAVDLAPTDVTWGQRALILLNASRQPGGNPAEVRQLLDDALASINQEIRHAAPRTARLRRTRPDPCRTWSRRGGIGRRPSGQRPLHSAARSLDNLRPARGEPCREVTPVHGRHNGDSPIFAAVKLIHAATFSSPRELGQSPVHKCAGSGFNAPFCT